MYLGAVVWTIGNLLTILAMPNHIPVKHNTISVVNLACADFLYCITNLPMYTLTSGINEIFSLDSNFLFQYFHMGWPGDKQPELFCLCGP